VVPTVLAVLIAGDEGYRLTAAYAVASALAALGYTAIFFAIAILSRNAVIVGLIYSLLWETILGGYAPGVRALSVRQWALAPAESMLRDHPTWGVTSEVDLGAGLVLLTATVVVATMIAIRRLETLPIRASE
jgi:ABC-2 type transport system permease protein